MAHALLHAKDAESAEHVQSLVANLALGSHMIPSLRLFLPPDPSSPHIALPWLVLPSYWRSASRELPVPAFAIKVGIRPIHALTLQA